MARRRSPLLLTRRITQAAFLLLTVGLILAARIGPAERMGPILIPRTSPLLGIAASVASRSLLAAFWPALIFLLLTPILGRVFCGWVCPLGTTIDATDRAISWFRRRCGTGLLPRAPKYLLLVAVLVLALLGVQAAAWLDPTSITVLTFSTFLHPVGVFLFDAGFDALYATPLRAAAAPVERFLEQTLFATSTLDAPTFLHAGQIALILFIVVGLSLRGRRGWCRMLCPLGALYALAARRPLLRLVITGDCTHCGACAGACKMAAITPDGQKIIAGECIRCGLCSAACPVSAVRYEWGRGRAEAEVPPDVSRRAVLGSVGVGIVALPLLRLASPAGRQSPHLIRPPGAAPPREFLQKCIRCGACMKVCPANAIHPCLGEAGLEGAFTPRVVPRIGNCEYNCTLCTQICPTGALALLSEEQKHRFVIGKAVIDRERCIAWSRQRECGVCEEVCPIPQKAIGLVSHEVQRGGRVEIVQKPVMKPDLCIGCGACENKCPVEGAAAIRVVGASGWKAHGPGGDRPPSQDGGGLAG